MLFARVFGCLFLLLSLFGFLCFVFVCVLVVLLLDYAVVLLAVVFAFLCVRVCCCVLLLLLCVLSVVRLCGVPFCVSVCYRCALCCDVVYGWFNVSRCCWFCVFWVYFSCLCLSFRACVNAVCVVSRLLVWLCC